MQFYKEIEKSARNMLREAIAGKTITHPEGDIQIREIAEDIYDGQPCLVVACDSPSERIELVISVGMVRI